MSGPVIAGLTLCAWVSGLFVIAICRAAAENNRQAEYDAQFDAIIAHLENQP